MKHPLVWNDWRVAAGVVSGATAILAGLGFVTRTIDEVRGLAIFTSLVAAFLGHAVTSMDGTLGTREFYLTRPISRRRYLRTRLLFAGLLVNAFVAATGAMIAFDLPAAFYGLFAESNAAARTIRFDFPAWYPAAILLPNLTLVIVVGAQLRGTRTASLMMGASVAVGLPIGAMLLVARYPQHYTLLATGFAVALAATLVFETVRLFGRFERLDVTGNFG